MDENKIEQQRKESIRGYVKHLSTLSTASMLLLIAFVEKLFTDPKEEYLIILSIIFFLASIIGGVLLYTLTLLENDNESQKTKFTKGIKVLSLIGIIFTWVGFLSGITSLAIFGIINYLY